MPIRIIAIGKKHEDWIENGIERYSKRLKKPFDVKWVILPNSHQNPAYATKDESERILGNIDPDDYVILLDEKGKNISSPTLAKLLTSQIAYSKTVTIIIGGAYGTDEAISKRADFVWSLSSLVFPHQLVRLILTEQIYRSQEISAGRPYHHE